MPGISTLVLSVSVAGAAAAAIAAAADFGARSGRGDRLPVAAETASVRWTTVQQRLGADISAAARVRLADRQP